MSSIFDPSVRSSSPGDSGGAFVTRRVNTGDEQVIGVTTGGVVDEDSFMTSFDDPQGQTFLLAVNKYLKERGPLSGTIRLQQIE